MPNNNKERRVEVSKELYAVLDNLASKVRDVMEYHYGNSGMNWYYGEFSNLMEKLKVCGVYKLPKSTKK